MKHLAGDSCGYFLDVFRVKRGSVITLFVAGYRNRSDAEKIADPDGGTCA
jgi:hypothetical protein